MPADLGHLAVTRKVGQRAVVLCPDGARLEIVFGKAGQVLFIGPKTYRFLRAELLGSGRMAPQHCPRLPV